MADGAPERLNNTEEMISAVQSAQQSALVCNSLQKRSLVDVGEISLDLHRPGDKHPRYTIHVLDQPKPRGARSFAAFIVPQGKETDWLFSTKEGRQQVLSSAQKDRLAIVTLRREHMFDNLDSIKNELHESIRDLAPDGLPPNTDIPFLSLGADVGVRSICYEGKSELSGSFVIEEIERDGREYRRLIFLSNPYVVQSEARLKQAKSRRGKTRKVVDPGFLACEHHVYMSVGVNAVVDDKGEDEILIVGLGGGGLCTFLYHCFPKLKITAVEIDKEIVKMATEYFGLSINKRVNVEIADGIEFIKDAAVNDAKYKAILFDVDSKDTTLGLSCPPKHFLELSILKCVANLLSDDGLFILNLVSRDKGLKQQAINDLKSIFNATVCCGIRDEVNEIIMCSTNYRDIVKWKEQLTSAAGSLNKRAAGQKLFTADGEFDMSSLIEGLSMESCKNTFT